MRRDNLFRENDGRDPVAELARTTVEPTLATRTRLPTIGSVSRPRLRRRIIRVRLSELMSVIGMTTHFQSVLTAREIALMM